jgi:hypothetical protein
MSNLANQEYTDDQLLVGSMLLHTILQQLSEEPKLKFDAFDLRTDKKNNQHILIIWKDEEKLEQIMLSNKKIEGCSLSEENQDKMKDFLGKEIAKIIRKMIFKCYN